MGTIQGMNGRLKIESKENVGTEFILTFKKAEKPSMIVSL
jgi:signal transduction histidine kinase